MPNVISVLRAGQHIWHCYRQTWKNSRQKLAREPEEHRLTRLGQDIDASLSDMALITTPHAGPDLLMPLRLRALGVDPQLVEKSPGSDYSAMQETCRCCSFWRRCAHELGASDTHSSLPIYCANASAMAKLIARSNLQGDA